MAEDDRETEHPPQRAKKKPQNERDHSDWKKTFQHSWERLFSHGWIPNIVTTVIFALVLVGLNVVVNTQKKQIFATALGLTLLIWLVALYVYRVVDRNDKAAANDSTSTGEELSGLLLARGLPDLQFDWGRGSLPPLGALRIYFGSCVAYTRKTGVVIFRVDGQDLLKMRRGPGGRGLLVSMEIYSDDGRIVAEIKDNYFYVNRNNFFRLERKPKGTLSIFDQKNIRVLYIDFLNADAVLVEGTFRSKLGSTVEVTESAVLINSTTQKGIQFRGMVHADVPDVVMNIH